MKGTWLGRSNAQTHTAERNREGRRVCISVWRRTARVNTLMRGTKGEIYMNIISRRRRDQRAHTH